MPKKKKTTEKDVHEALLDIGRLEAEFDDLKALVIEMEEYVAETKDIVELALSAESSDYPELKIKYDRMVRVVEEAHGRAAVFSARMVELKKKEATLLASFYGENEAD